MTVLETLAGQSIHLSHFRGPPPDPREARWYKEWLHFCIVGTECNLLINLSVMNHAAGSAGNRPRARLLVLVDRRGVWQGNLEEIPAERFSFSPGRVDCRFGDTTLVGRGKLSNSP